MNSRRSNLHNGSVALSHYEKKMLKKKLSLLRFWTGILLGLLIVLASNLHAFAWTTPINISHTTGRSKLPTVEVDENNHVHVIWQDNTLGNNDILYCLNDGGDWSTPVNLSNNPTDSENSNIIIDAAGHPHVVWEDWDLGEIFWTFYDGFSWSSPANISSTPGPSYCPRLAADDSGRVFVVWFDEWEQWDIYFSVYDGIAWSTPQNLTNDPVDSAFPDIAIDSKGCIHLVWMDYGNIDIYYSKYDGNSWSGPVNVSPLAGWAVDPKVIVDSQDRPHVVWEQRSGGFLGYYTFYDDSTWQEPMKISDFDPLRVPEIDFDSQDVLHAVWTTAGEVGGEAYWNHCAEGSWSLPYNLSNTPDEASGSPDIGVDSFDILHVTYVEFCGDNWEILYTQNNPTRVDSHVLEKVPRLFKLEQNYPNPFNSETTIHYCLSAGEPTHLSIIIYNLLGEKVTTLVNGKHISGEYLAKWNGKDKNGMTVSSGIYFYHLRAGNLTATRKMVLVH